MMLISKTIRQKLTVLAVGSSLFAGCSSGPELSSIRFWPGGEKMDSAADDEAVAQKWRDRLNASALSSGFGAAPGFDTAQAEKDATESRSSRFNIFRRFSRNKETEVPQTPKTAESGIRADQQRLALERKIAELEAERRVAELEAERRALQQQQQAAARAPQTGSFDPRQGSEASDPFRAAAQANQTSPKKQIVRPAVRPAPQRAAADNSLPSWAQPSEQNASATPASREREVAVNPGSNAFNPELDQTLNQREAPAQRQANAGSPKGKAPAMPADARPVITPRKPNPFAQMEQQTAAATNSGSSRPAPPMPRNPQPEPERPVAEANQRHQLASLRSAEEQQRVWAQLEVHNLLKHSRAQARAGQLDEALTTALAAEQLANSADVEFHDGVQTPAQLVSLIRLKAEELRSKADQTKNEPKQAIAARESRGNLNVHPDTPTDPPSQKVSKKTVAPPQWPGRTAAMKPDQVIGDYHPLVSTPGDSGSSAPDDSLQTADFVHPRPGQAVLPHASTSDQWSARENHPLLQPSRKSGGYMEAQAAPRRSSNEINAQFVSSKSIYSPENLKWTSLDAARATIVEETLIPAPPMAGKPPADQEELPPLEADLQDIPADDPFATVFDQAEVSDTLLSSDDPLPELAPSLPVNGQAEATEAPQEQLLFGIPVRKLGLVLLAGLILLAAIVHRRRTSEFHEM